MQNLSLEQVINNRRLFETASRRIAEQVASLAKCTEYVYGEDCYWLTYAGGVYDDELIDKIPALKVLAELDVQIAAYIAAALSCRPLFEYSPDTIEVADNRITTRLETSLTPEVESIIEMHLPISVAHTWQYVTQFKSHIKLVNPPDLLIDLDTIPVTLHMRAELKNKLWLIRLDTDPIAD